MKNSTPQFQGPAPGPAFGRRGVQRRRWQRITSSSSSSPTAPPPTLTEKNIKTGSQRAVSVDGAGPGSTAIPSPPPPPLASLKSFFLPQGWPHSVSQDYLRYQIWTFPSHVTGWMSHSLAGSSMLKALGVGTSAAGAVGFSAAIKWVTKDGVGAVGRLFVGGRLSSVFDEDPRRWRMIAEAVTTLGLALEIATQLSPANFVTLAGAGTLAKATGKGMGRPCFRVVQTHFAASNNVGDVSAKEEVWEVAAQLLGLAASVGVLTALEAAGTPEAVIPVWTAVHAVHVALRYAALAQLRFPYPNYKRGAALVAEHVAGRGVLTVDRANAEEAVLPGPTAGAGGLRCAFGCSVEELLGGGGGGGGGGNEGLGGTRSPDLGALLDLYRSEAYLLTWRSGGAHVVLWEGAGPQDMLRALWQAAWLRERMGGSDNGDEEGAAPLALLADSVAATRAGFPELAAAATAVGWELHRGGVPLRQLPSGPHPHLQLKI